ncbi:MAG TPA: GGDEF domain-containing protein [Candidatus Tumulicola sp.]
MTLSVGLAWSALAIPPLAALALWAARRRVRYASALERAYERRERRLLDAVFALLDASRRSSAAVLSVLDAALRDVDAKIDSVLVFVPIGDELVCVRASGARVRHFERLQLRRDDVGRLPVKAAETGCRATLPAGGAALLPTDRYAIAVPMTDVLSLQAVIYASSCEELRPAPADAIVRAVESAATPYAIALEREADRTQATYDALTGLFGPRAFRHRLHDEVARSNRDRERYRVVSVWFVDTDCFKDVNDRFGHLAGDAVLQTMASLLAAHLVADLDLAGRNGGDEFCALLRGVGKSRAISRAQAFCDAVRGYDFGLPVRITASIGVATHPHDARNSNELLEAADAAMYHSKRNGRDRVSFLVERGTFACVRSEAGKELSRSSSRWCRSNAGESFAERSSQ